MRRVLLACALATGIAAHSPSPRAADAPQCKLVRIAEWPVRLQRGLPVIDGAINGQKVGVLLDTGAYASLITKASAEKLGLLTQIGGAHPRRAPAHCVKLRLRLTIDAST